MPRKSWNGWTRSSSLSQGPWFPSLWPLGFQEVKASPKSQGFLFPVWVWVPGPRVAKWLKWTQDSIRDSPQKSEFGSRIGLQRPLLLSRENVFDVLGLETGGGGGRKWIKNGSKMDQKSGEKWVKKDKKEKPTASSVPRRSPIQVLTGLNVA